MLYRAVLGRLGGGKLAVAGCSLLLACVNRGMHAPDPDAGDGPGILDARLDRSGSGGARTDATIDARDAGANVDATADAGAIGGNGAGGSRSGVGGNGAGGTGTGGATGTGTGGTTGTGGATGAGGSGVDARPADVPSVCGARFNFENGSLDGAFINTGYQTSFSSLTHAMDARCGAGSLQVNVSLSPSSAKGELILPLGATESLAGRTVSLSLKMTPQESPNAYVIVFAVPSYTFIMGLSPIPAVWANASVTMPSGADAGTTATTGISLQVIGQGDSYTGVLLLDEVDIR